MAVYRSLSVAVAGLLAGTVVLQSQVQTGSKIGPDIETVAVVSVYGPPDASIGITKKMPTQELIDHVEAEVVGMLHRKGVGVLPLAATAARVQAGFDDAYYNALEPANKAALDALQDYKEYFKVRRRADHNRNSAHTTVLKEYWRQKATPITVDYENAKYDALAGSGQGQARDLGFDYATHYRKALGSLVKQAGAQAYVIVRVLTGTEDFNKGGHDYIFESSSGRSYPRTGVYPVVRLDIEMLNVDGTQVFMRSSTGIADKAVGMMQILKMSWDEKEAAERFFNAADLALAAIAKRITGPRNAVQMAADVMAPPAPGVTLAWTGNEPGSPVGAASGVTVKADQLAGRWELVDVNSQPLPYNNNGTVISGGFYEFKADGTYTWVVDNLVQERGSAKTKTSNISGTYTIDGNLVRMKPKGLLASLGNSLTGNAPLEVRGDGTACLSWTGQTFDYRKK